ncbi:glycosyltransferase family 4 protein [Desemzia incerta]|uniref:glycosyltransferase family 4 protein n=1 Tax=Desemzia incerta TaxID=82801 RepID=UPI00331600E0
MKVAIITTYADKIFSSRYELIMSLIKKGHTVTVIGTEELKDSKEYFEKYEVVYKRILFGRSNTNPYKEIKFIKYTQRVLKQLNLDVLIVYGVRLAASMSIAAKLAGIKKVYSIINGAGTLFNIGGVKGKLILSLSYPLLFSGLRLSNKVFFQNMDNREMFIKMRLVGERKTCIVNGSGVNLEKFYPNFDNDENKTFLFTGRMIRDKGINEFIAATKKVKEIFPEYKFLIIGPFDENITAVNSNEVSKLIEEGLLEHISWTNDINKYMRDCFVFVLPSYHEGLPRTTLEAMASGKPIITTDVPGCRETVIDGLNGFLIPAKNTEALAKKMVWMIENRERTNHMGKESLKLVKEKFDVHVVNNSMLSKMEL